jgi:hypothetical protein
MRTAIDDFPCISASKLRAAGEVRSDMKTITVQFPGGSDVSFVVALTHRRFPNGGGWSFFRCRCGRVARILSLCDSALACRGCLKARGLRHRVELIATPARTACTAPRRLARLTSQAPVRLHPRSGRLLDRRSSVEASLRRSLIVARQHALDEHHERLAKLMRDK